MSELAIGSVRVQDLPVCLPGRSCVDQTPMGAHLMHLLGALTPASPLIAAVCFALLGASLVLAVIGLARQRREAGMRPWLAIVITGLLLVGAVIGRAVSGWFSAISAISSGVHGQPASQPPSSLIAAWPAVQWAGRGMVILGVIALVLALHTASIRRRQQGAGAKPRDAQEGHDPGRIEDPR